MNAQAHQALGEDEARALLRDMLRIRRFEERCAELYTKEKIRGFLHLYIGEEAVATGVVAMLQPTDAVFGTYREHGHALLRGVTARSVMAEMFGKIEGCSGGRGGSMHLFDVKRYFYGGSAIVAGHLPMAVGMALAQKMGLAGGDTDAGDAITVCFFGEGAVAEGAFHEALNLASLWRLPVLFVCENNLYAMGTALHRSEAQTALVAKAAGYNLPAASVDGMDVLAVRDAARAAVAVVRAGEPFFLEARTYRFRAHSMFDPQLYRSREEVEGWMQHDPIMKLESRLREDGLLDDGALAAVEAEVQAEVDDAVTYAEAGEWESEEDLLRHVTAPEGAWESAH